MLAVAWEAPLPPLSTLVDPAFLTETFDYEIHHCWYIDVHWTEFGSTWTQDDQSVGKVAASY